MTHRREPGGGQTPHEPVPGDSVPRNRLPGESIAAEPFASSTDDPRVAEPTEEEPAGPGGAGPSPRPSFAQQVLDGLWRANTATVTVLAMFLAAVIGGILIIVSDPDVRSTYGYFFAEPSAALSASWSVVSDAYANLFKGAIVDPAAVQAWIHGGGDWHKVFYPISETLTYASPLVFTGLAVAVAFRGGLFNIGAQGQAIIGVILAGVIGFAVPLPVGLHLVVALLAGAAGGALWGFIPGVLKARTGAHEVITTIMLNYIAQLFLDWIITQNGVHSPSRPDAISKELDSSAKLPPLLGDNLRVDAGIIVAIFVAWGVAWLMNRSTFGFELRAVGANPSAARTAGMSVARTTILVMVISGALAGIGGSVTVLGSQANALTGSVTGNVGFDGILVALLGRVKPWGVVLAAILFGALNAGATRMQGYSGISAELGSVLQALIVMFVAAPAVIKAIFKLRAGRSGKLETTLAKGW